MILLLPLLTLSLSAGGDDTADRRAAVEAHLIPSAWVAEVPVSLEQRMRELQVPGVSVAVAVDGHLDWAQGYGVRDAATGAPVTTETLFQAGSISKPLAALTALRLAKREKLDLDEPIRGFLTSCTLPASRFEKEVPLTLRHLLSHTGGTTVHGFGGYATFQAAPTVPQLLSGAFPANSDPVVLDRPPGIGVRYSGGGTTIAQLAMTDVSGEPFATLTRAVTLTPLGMTRSTYEQPLDTQSWPDHSAGHLADGRVQPGRFRVHPEQAAAGLWTTASDIVRFALEMQRAWHGESEVVAQEVARWMLTPVQGNAGMGVFVEAHAGQRWFGHGGSNIGFKNTFHASFDGGRAVCVLTNGDQGIELANEIVGAVARVYGWEGWVEPALHAVPLDEETRAACVGLYSGGWDEAYRVEVRGEELVLLPRPGSPGRLVHLGEARFLALGAGVELTFEDADEPGFTRVALRSGGLAKSLARVPEEEAPPSELLARGELDDALAAYRARRAARPGDPAVSAARLNGLALGFSSARADAAATALARLAVELYPEDANAWDTLGQLLLVDGQREEALDAYRVCLDLLAEEADPPRWFATHVPAVADWLAGGRDE